MKDFNRDSKLKSEINLILFELTGKNCDFADNGFDIEKLMHLKTRLRMRRILRTYLC